MKIDKKWIKDNLLTKVGGLCPIYIKRISDVEKEEIIKSTSFLLNEPTLKDRIKCILFGIVEHKLCDYCRSPVNFSNKSKEVFSSNFCSMKCAKQTKTEEEYLEELSRGNYPKMVGKYEGYAIKTLHECLCGTEWNATPRSIIEENRLCLSCGYEKRLNPLKINHEEFLKRLENSEGNVELAPGQQIDGLGKRKWFICECSLGWFTQPSTVLLGCRCNVCTYKESGEKRKSPIEEMEDFKLYQREVWKNTNRNLKFIKDIDLRGKNYHLDHKFSISRGFKRGIIPSIIGSIINLEIISARENLTKNFYCSITEEELFECYFKNRRVLEN
jgi:hypothetical protein